MQEIGFEKGSFASSYKNVKCSYRIYAPKKPLAVIQLSHGMCEYVGRYEEHAKYFASQGFVFCGNDHIGHGETADNASELGFTGSADCLVDDVARMTEIIKEKYPHLPIFLLGHSMGSFIAREYITRHAERINGCILSGTAGPGNPTGFGKKMAAFSAKLKGDHYRDPIIVSLSTGGYGKHFGANAPKTAWVTSNDVIREKYDNDPLCNYVFTVNGYYNMFELLGRVSKKAWFDKVPSELPIMFISGKDDPVGDCGRGVMKVYMGMKGKDVSLVLINSARHEPLNETDDIRELTYKYIKDWINGRI